MAVLKADTKARRILVIFILTLMIITPWGFIEFDEFLKQKKHQEVINILRTALSLTFLLCLPMAAYLYRLGHRILEAGQFPLPGAKVWRDTEIITGDSARGKAHIIKKLSLLMAFVSLYSSFYFYFLFFPKIDFLKIKNFSFMSLSKTYGILAVILAISIGVSLLICKRIDSYLSKNQTKEKEIKPKIIIQDKKTLLANVLNYIFWASLTMMILTPFHYIYEIVLLFLFPFPFKETVVESMAILLYIFTTTTIYIVLFIYVWRWLKKNLDLTDLQIKKKIRKADIEPLNQ